MPRLIPGPQAAIWAAAETATAAAFALVGLLGVARVIGPQQAGLGALAASAFLLVEGPISMLFGDALMQRRELEPRHVASAFWMTLAAAGAAAVGLALLAPLIAAASGLPAMTPMLQVLALLLPFSGLSGMFSGLALRERRYRRLAMRTMVGQPVALLCGITAGLHGAGAWALVTQQLVATLLSFTVMALWFRPWPAPMLDRPALRELWRVAGPQVLALLVLTGRYRAFILVLGIVSSELVVAVTHIAFRMVEVAAAMVLNTLGQLAMPRLAALQDNRNSLAESYGMLSRWQALGGLPLALGLAIVAPRLIEAMMGPAWAAAGPPAQVLGVSSALWIVGGPVISLWLAMGRTRMNLVVQALACAIPVALLALLRPQSPEVAALCWAGTAVLPVWQLHLVLRALHRDWLWMLRWLAPSLLAALAMTVAALAVHEASMAWPATYALAATIGAGALAWSAVLGLWSLRQAGSRNWLSMASVSAGGSD